MENQTNIINPPREGLLGAVRSYWQIIISLMFAVSFIFLTYFKFTDMQTKLQEALKDIAELKKEKLDKHEYQDLEDRVTRQYNAHNESINRVRAEFNPVRDWVEWKKGYDQALKDMRK